VVEVVEEEKIDDRAWRERFMTKLRYIQKWWKAKFANRRVVNLNNDRSPLVLIGKIKRKERMKDGEVKEYFIELWQKNKKGPLRDIAVGYIHRAYESHLNFVNIHLDEKNNIRKIPKHELLA
jgi:hypothetical protein